MDQRNKKGQFAKGCKASDKLIESIKLANTGNTYALKLNSLELKLEAYRQYCEHLALGKSKRSWCFEHPEMTLTCISMDKYIEQEPDIFDPLQMEAAKTKGYKRWEQVVEDSADGTNKDANTASLQMLMRNKYRWDREDNVNKDTSEPLVKSMAERWRNTPDETSP